MLLSLNIFIKLTDYFFCRPQPATIAQPTNMFVKTLLIGLAMLLLQQTYAQTGTINGTVKDSLTGVVLESATVSVYGKDSSLINYRLSDARGTFSLSKIPLHKAVRLTVSYVNYKTVTKRLVLDSATTTINVLLVDAGEDNNVVVTNTAAPIRMNGDTLEINPAAFNMKADAVVEELLNQVPGTTIWSDGTITVNGKLVQNVLVDGKQFMGSSDSRVATQNLPKSAIDKIQLYQEYDRSQIGSQGKKPTDSLLTMNIKLKEESKRGYFGKASAGYGTRERYEGDFSMQSYNKTSSIGVGGGHNNINKSIGNLQEMFQNNTYRNYNPNLYNVGRFGRGGINKNYSLGAVGMHSFIETSNNRQNNRLTVNYNYAGSDGFITSEVFQNRTTPNNPEIVTETGVQNRSNDSHDVGLNYIKTNSYNDQLSLNGTMKHAEDQDINTRDTRTMDTAYNLKSTNNVTNSRASQTNSGTLNLNFAKGDRDEPLLNFNTDANVSVNNSKSTRFTKSIFDSYSDNSKDTTYNRRYNNDNKSINAMLSLNYNGFKRLIFRRFNFYGIGLNFRQRLNYAKQTEDSKVADLDSSAKLYRVNTRLSNNNEHSLFIYTPEIGFNKTFDKYNRAGYRYVSISVNALNDFQSDKNKSSIASRNLNRTFSFFRYEANINYNSRKQEKYSTYASLGYRKSFEFADVDRLLPIVDDIDAYNIRRGNPNLKNVTTHNFFLNLSYRMEKPLSLYGFNAQVNGNYNLLQNPFIDSVINDNSGKRIFYYTNADNSRNYNLNYTSNLSRKIQKSQIQLIYNGSINNNRTPNYIDTTYTKSSNTNINNNFSLQFSLRTVLILNVGKTYGYYKTTQSDPKLQPSSSKSDVTRLGITVNASKNLTFNSTLDNTKNTGIVDPITLWNFFASYRFMGQQAEVKFSAMDILKQYENITNNANSYGTTIRSTNGLQQYFLLTFSYYPRKFGKTEIKRR